MCHPAVFLLLTTVVTCSSSRFHAGKHNKCPHACVCYEEDLRVQCSNLSQSTLSQVLSQAPDDVQYLDLRGSWLEHVNKDTFNRLDQLHHLDLSNNIIRKLHTQAFSHMSQLAVLTLEDNQLSNASVGLIDLPASLHTINLASNGLTGEFLNTARWAHVQNLQMQRNQIPRLPAEFFARCSGLRMVNASHNAIRDLQGEAGVSQLLVTLDLSWNALTLLDSTYFRMFPNLRHLYLQGNRITSLTNSDFSALVNLQYLDLSYNYFDSIPPDIFMHNANLGDLVVTFLPNLTTVNPDSFNGLASLQMLDMSHNYKLSHLHMHSFQHLTSVVHLNLSHDALQTLHEGIFANSSILQEIRLGGNPWSCDCNLKWIYNDGTNNTNNLVQLINPGDLICASPSNLTGQLFLDIPESDLSCRHPSIITHYDSKRYFRVGSPAVLDCQADGDPLPATMWITNRNKVFYHHQSLVSLDSPQPHDIGYHFNHTWHTSDEYPEEHHKKHKERMHVLQNGSLYIDFVMRHDAGPFTCMAHNELGNVSITVHFRLDYRIIIRLTTESIIVGFCAAGIAFVGAVIFGLLKELVAYCHRERTQAKQKRRTLREIIESLEAYKSAKFGQISAYKTAKIDQISAYKTAKFDQISAYKSEKMDKLSAYKTARLHKLKHAKEHTVASLVNYVKSMRDHYHCQINSIKENCTEQAHRLRENYNNRVSRLKDYKTHQVEKIRDNYHSQVARIKDYGSFQLEKLRDQYKLQQQHVLKLLELLNLDHCRGVVEAECMRTDSMLFEPNLTIDIDPGSPPQVSPENSSCAGSDDFVTASSNSDTSQENLPDAVQIDVMAEPHVISHHLDVGGVVSALADGCASNSEEALDIPVTIAMDQYIASSSAQAEQDSPGEGTSRSHRCYRKGKRSSWVSPGDAGRALAGTSSPSANQPLPGSSDSPYEISIISASVPEYNDPIIPKESSV